MPKINIWEDDQSASTYLNGGETVFVPVQGTAPSGTTLDRNGCKLYNSESDYTISSTDYVSTILQSGLKALVYYTNETSIINLSAEALDFLRDKDLYDIKFLSSGAQPTVIVDNFSAGIPVNHSFTRTGSAGSYVFTQAENKSIENTAYFSLDATKQSVNVGDSVAGLYIFNNTPTTTYTQQDTGNTAAEGVDYYKVATSELSASIDTTLLNVLNHIAARRGDCAVIASLHTEGKPLKLIKSLLDGDIDGLSAPLNDAEAKRGALFAANMQTVDGGYALDSYPDLAYFNRFSVAKRSGNQWDAVAGTTRGKLDFFNDAALVTKFALDNDVIGKEGYSFNGICTVRPSGYTIWGDRTLLKNVSDVKASSFLSIRNIVSDLYKRIYRQAVISTYETNNEITWANFKNEIVNLLEEMIQSQVIANYRINKVKATERATIACKVNIAPYGPVENFDVGIILTSEGLDVNIE